MLLKSETRSSTVRVFEAKNLKNTCFLPLFARAAVYDAIFQN